MSSDEGRHSALEVTRERAGRDHAARCRRDLAAHGAAALSPVEAASRSEPGIQMCAGRLNNSPICWSSPIGNMRRIWSTRWVAAYRLGRMRFPCTRDGSSCLARPVQLIVHAADERLRGESLRSLLSLTGHRLVGPRRRVPQLSVGSSRVHERLPHARAGQTRMRLLAGLSNHLRGFDLDDRRTHRLRVGRGSVFRWRRDLAAAPVPSLPPSC